MQWDRLQYLSFLLRLWRTSSGGEYLWQASVEDPLTGATTGFGTIEALFAFLRAQMGAVSDANRDDRDGTSRA
jgi:hypothetical protein